MAITDYEELQEAVAGWLNRDDLEDRIPEFIAVGEAKINRKLRTIDQFTTVDLSIDDEFEDVPAGWVQTANLSHDDQTGGEIEYLTPQMFVRQRRTFVTAGRLRYYTLDGRRLRFLPAPDAAYPVVHSYYVRVPALTDLAPTNWLLDAHPDIYLSAALLAANTYLRDVEGVTLATAELADIIDSIQQANGGDKTSTTPVMRAQAI